MIETFLTYTLFVSVAIFLLYFLGISLAPYIPNKIKNEHFECGLPASSSTPKKANFGFFVYAIMFISADMTGLFFVLFIYSSDKHSYIVASVFALIMAFVLSVSVRELHKGEQNA